MTRHRRQTILLLGPTASGKTPLGDALERCGAFGRHCRHFDFGEKLRVITNGDETGDLAEVEIAYLADTLARGALLTNERFYLAKKILNDFLISVEDDALIIMNGLPRQLNQALEVDRILNVRAVIELSCSIDTIMARIVADPDSDRMNRNDDDETLVERKLAIYETETKQLRDHYRRYGAQITTIEVKADTTAMDVVKLLPKSFD